MPNGMRTVIAVQKELKAPMEGFGTGCRYNFKTVGTVQISEESARAILEGDPKPLQAVLDNFRESGLYGFHILQLALGGKGIYASISKKKQNWRHTGMPKIWEGEI